jgi:hypothetical protein
MYISNKDDRAKSDWRGTNGDESLSVDGARGALVTKKIRFLSTGGVVYSGTNCYAW